MTKYPIEDPCKKKRERREKETPPPRQVGPIVIDHRAQYPERHMRHVVGYTTYAQEGKIGKRNTKERKPSPTHQRESAWSEPVSINGDKRKVREGVRTGDCSLALFGTSSANGRNGVRQPPDHKGPIPETFLSCLFFFLYRLGRIVSQFPKPDLSSRSTLFRFLRGRQERECVIKDSPTQEAHQNSCVSPVVDVVLTIISHATGVNNKKAFSLSSLRQRKRKKSSAKTSKGNKEGRKHKPEKKKKKRRHKGTRKRAGVKDVGVRERGSIALPREQARNALVT